MACFRVVILAAFLALPAFAGELVVLVNGFRLAADGHEPVGERVIIHTRDGSLEFPASAIAEFQPDEQKPPAVTPVAQPAATQSDPKQLVTEAAVRLGLPPELAHGVAKVESNYNQAAVSPKGARGIMQLMPATGRQLSADATNAKQNIEAGVRYLRDLLLRYEHDPEPVRRALAAYNAGPGAVARFQGVPPYRETQLYVEKVLQQYWKQVKK